MIFLWILPVVDKTMAYYDNKYTYILPLPQDNKL